MDAGFFATSEDVANALIEGDYGLTDQDMLTGDACADQEFLNSLFLQPETEIIDTVPVSNRQKMQDSDLILGECNESNFSGVQSMPSGEATVTPYEQDVMENVTIMDKDSADGSENWIGVEEIVIETECQSGDTDNDNEEIVTLEEALKGGYIEGNSDCDEDSQEEIDKDHEVYDETGVDGQEKTNNTQENVSQDSGVDIDETVMDNNENCESMDTSINVGAGVKVDKMYIEKEKDNEGSLLEGTLGAESTTGTYDREIGQKVCVEMDTEYCENANCSEDSVAAACRIVTDESVLEQDKTELGGKDSCSRVCPGKDTGDSQGYKTYDSVGSEGISNSSELEENRIQSLEEFAQGKSEEQNGTVIMESTDVGGNEDVDRHKSGREGGAKSDEVIFSGEVFGVTVTSIKPLGKTNKTLEKKSVCRSLYDTDELNESEENPCNDCGLDMEVTLHANEDNRETSNSETSITKEWDNELNNSVKSRNDDDKLHIDCKDKESKTMEDNLECEVIELDKVVHKKINESKKEHKKERALEEVEPICLVSDDSNSDVEEVIMLSEDEEDEKPLKLEEQLKVEDSPITWSPVKHQTAKQPTPAILKPVNPMMRSQVQRLQKPENHRPSILRRKRPVAAPVNPPEPPPPPTSLPPPRLPSQEQVIPIDGDTPVKWYYASPNNTPLHTRLKIPAPEMRILGRPKHSPQTQVLENAFDTARSALETTGVKMSDLMGTSQAASNQPPVMNFFIFPSDNNKEAEKKLGNYGKKRKFSEQEEIVSLGKNPVQYISEQDQKKIVYKIPRGVFNSQQSTVRNSPVNKQFSNVSSVTTEPCFVPPAVTKPPIVVNPSQIHQSYLSKNQPVIIQNRPSIVNQIPAKVTTLFPPQQSRAPPSEEPAQQQTFEVNRRLLNYTSKPIPSSSSGGMSHSHTISKSTIGSTARGPKFKTLVPRSVELVYPKPAEPSPNPTECVSKPSGRRYMNGESINEVMERIIPTNESVRCARCRTEFSELTLFKKHFAYRFCIMPIKCHHCVKHYTKLEEFLAHFKSMHQNCMFCACKKDHFSYHRLVAHAKECQYSCQKLREIPLDHNVKHGPLVMPVKWDQIDSKSYLVDIVKTKEQNRVIWSITIECRPIADIKNILKRRKKAEEKKTLQPALEGSDGFTEISRTASRQRTISVFKRGVQRSQSEDEEDDVSVISEEDFNKTKAQEQKSSGVSGFVTVVDQPENGELQIPPHSNENNVVTLQTNLPVASHSKGNVTITPQTLNVIHGNSKGLRKAVNIKRCVVPGQGSNEEYQDLLKSYMSDHIACEALPPYIEIADSQHRLTGVQPEYAPRKIITIAAANKQQSLQAGSLVEDGDDEGERAGTAAVSDQGMKEEEVTDDQQSNIPESAFKTEDISADDYTKDIILDNLDSKDTKDEPEPEVSKAQQAERTVAETEIKDEEMDSTSNHQSVTNINIPEKASDNVEGYICTECNESFKYHLHLMHHIGTTHNEDGCQCYICQRKSFQAKMLHKDSIE